MARLQKKKPVGARKKKNLNPVVDGGSTPIRQASSTAAAVRGRTEKGVVKKSIAAKKRSPKSMAVSASGQRQGWVQRSIQFLREVRVELKKVTWPTRKQTIGSTVVVLILTFIISVFLGLVDVGLTNFVRVILQ